MFVLRYCVMSSMFISDVQIFGQRERMMMVAPGRLVTRLPDFQQRLWDMWDGKTRLHSERLKINSSRSDITTHKKLLCVIVAT